MRDMEKSARVINELQHVFNFNFERSNYYVQLRNLKGLDLLKDKQKLCSCDNESGDERGPIKI